MTFLCSYNEIMYFLCGIFNFFCSRLLVCLQDAITRSQQLFSLSCSDLSHLLLSLVLLFGKDYFITAHQRSCRKLMFSVACVFHSDHRGQITPLYRDQSSAPPPPPVQDLRICSNLDFTLQGPCPLPHDIQTC